MSKELAKSNTSVIPYKWQERFLLKRIDEDDIEIGLETRNAILTSMAKGARFVQVGKYTIMLNSIKSIDPKFGEANIPPRPKPVSVYEIVDDRSVARVVNQAELDEWDRLFGNGNESGGE